MNDENEQRAAVVAEARSWLRTPYHHMGRVKGAGVDCAMLPAEVYAEAGVVAPQAIAYYPPDWHLHHSAERYLSHVLKLAHEIAGPPRQGDFCLFRVGRALAHGAIVVDWPTVIHADARSRAVVLADALRDPAFRTRSGALRERHFYSMWGGN